MVGVSVGVKVADGVYVKVKVAVGVSDGLGVIVGVLVKEATACAVSVTFC